MCSIHKDPNGIIELVRQGLQKASVEQDELGYKKKFHKVVFGSTKKHSA
jgi:hypothetical protein